MGVFIIENIVAINQDSCILLLFFDKFSLACSNLCIHVHVSELIQNTQTYKNMKRVKPQGLLVF